MLTRRAFLGSALLAGCGRDPLEVGDVPLAKSLIPIKFTGLDTSKDPKTGAVGRVQLLENAQAIRDTDGGIELRKWPGSAALGKNIDGGGTISAGTMLYPFRDQLMALDGRYLYGYTGRSGAEWARKGPVTALSSVRVPVDANTISTAPLVCDGAYASGTVVMISAAAAAASIKYFVYDSTSGALAGRGQISSAYVARPRVLAIGTTFYLLYYKVGTGIVCLTMAAASGSPAFGSEQTAVAEANMDTSGFGSDFDAAVDTGNSRILIAYRNSASGLGLQIWNSNNTAGASANYNTRNPNQCLGILHHAWNDGHAYIGIGTSASGVRALAFDSSTLANTADVQADAGVTNATNITGYYNAGTTLFYDTANVSPTQNCITKAWDGTTAAVMIRSVGLGSKVFKIGSIYYFAAVYDSGTQKHLYLIEYEAARGSTATTRYSVAGHLKNGDAAVLIGGPSGLNSSIGSPALLAADRAWLAYPGWQLKTAAGVSDTYLSQFHDLRFNGSLLGSPVAMNNELHIPGACPRVCDGRTVVEEGWLVLPEAPAAVASGSAGSMTTGTYRYLLMWKRRNASGDIVRSDAGPSTSVTLTAGQTAVDLTVPQLRVTSMGTGYGNSDITVTIEIYRTTNGGTGFHLLKELVNDPTVDTASTTDGASDTTVAAGEELYTDTGAVGNDTPPEVLAYAAHRDRLFAISGDGALYFTKETSGGDALAFSDADGFFLDFDQNDGAFTGIVSDGTTLFVSKRSRIYLVSGDGPSLDGNNSYSFPQPLPSEVGFVGPRGFCGTPDGILFKSAKGFHLLDRGGGIQAVRAPAAYDSLTVNGGAVVDDRTMAYFVTAEGRTLAWDWFLKQWYATSAGRQPAVACARWQNQFVYLKSDGSVVKEVVSSFADDGASYTMKVDLAWEYLHRCRLYKVLIVGDAKATCTLSGSVGYDFDESTLSTPKTIALTTASRPPWVLQPARGKAQALLVHIEETSATEGVRLAEVDLEVGLKQGAAKAPSGKYMR